MMRKNLPKNQLLKPQKYLGQKGLILLIAVIHMFVPLSIDMYLPALPTMTDYFQATSSSVNLTLVGFFFFYAVGILLFGPLSDKFGRKPLMLMGVVVYVLFSAGCAISTTIWQLIFFRVLQALGAGSMAAVSTALIKDSFDGKIRDRVLAIVQALAVIGPMIAPLVGAFILQFFSWRSTFWILVIIGSFCLLTTFFLEETLDRTNRYQGKLSGALGRLYIVATHKGFTSYLIIASLLAAPYMAYIAVCSYIYIDYFQLSQQLYSYFFAFNSACAILGPILYLHTIDRLGAKRLNWLIFMVCLGSGLFLLFFGSMGPWVFMLSFLPFTLVESAIRPLSTSILLNQHEGDAGSASSLINFTQTAIGSLGMILGALPWGNFVFGLGILMIAFVAVSLVGWIALLKSKFTLVGLK